MVSILFLSSFHPTFGDDRFPASISGDGELRRGMEDAKQVYVSSLSIVFSPFLRVWKRGWLGFDLGFGNYELSNS